MKQYSMYLKKFFLMWKIYGLKSALARVRWFLANSRNSKVAQTANEVFFSDTEKVVTKFVLGNSNHDVLLYKYLEPPNRTPKHSCDNMCSNVDDPIITVIVPTIGRSKILQACLKSIATSVQNARIPFEIILAIDSSISREESEYLSTVLKNFNCNSLKVLRHEQKVSGFAHQVNAAARMAKGSFLLILNDDTISDPSLVFEMWKYADSRSRNVIAPLILNFDGTIQEFGSIITPSGHCEWIGTGHSPEWLGELDAMKVPFASAVCWLIARNIYVEVGGLKNLSNRPYFEDSKFLLDQNHNLHTICVATAIIYHSLSESLDQASKEIASNLISKPLFQEWWRNRKAVNPRKLKIIALYLPQFHFDPHNDYWWGVGYTEWTAISRWARNIVEQPNQKIPSELGFYNLMDQRTIERQSSLALKYGVDAFAVMTYWFSGERVLETPLQHFLSDKVSIKFFIFWANESWNRRWDGHEEKTLMKQEHSIEDSRNFIRAHKNFLEHPRYHKIGNKPVLMIYRREKFEDVRSHIEAMRDEARLLGIGDIFLCVCESFQNSVLRTDPTFDGFDAAVEYPPHGVFPLSHHSNYGKDSFEGRTHSYELLSENYADRPISGFPIIKGAMTGFDNTGRLGRKATIFLNSSPTSFYQWLYRIAKYAMVFGDNVDNTIIINAWNEWSESAALEPSTNDGREYLQSVKIVKDIFNSEVIDVRHE